MRRILLFTLFLTSSAFAQTTITSVHPASGTSSGGTFVYIVGTDLVGLPLACPALSCSNYVQFGDVLGQIVTNTDIEIVAVAPPHGEGPVDVTVNIAGKKALVIPNGFRYEALPNTDTERILLPIVGPLRPGAHGSTWSVETTLYNASDEDVPATASNCNPVLLIPCAKFHLPPHETIIPTLWSLPDFDGAFIFVPRAHVRDVDISIRIQDTSRQAQTWGTTIPAVRATDFQRAVRLNAVPTDSRFRVSLRVYGYDVTSDPVSIRIFDAGDSKLLVDLRFDLRGTASNTLFPSYLRIDSLADAYPQIRGHDRVRVEVASAFIPAKPIWSFVTVTNNDTQQVTTITPSLTASP